MGKYLQKIDLENIFDVVKSNNFLNYKGITIHHGASTGTLENYAKYHVEKRKWRDFGYQFGIDTNGDIYISCRNESRWINQYTGAHCTQKVSLDKTVVLPKSANACTIGIVLRGDFYKDSKPSKEQIKTLFLLVRKLMHKFNIKVNQIYRHDQFTPKAHGCPGKSFDSDMFLTALQIIEGVV